MSRNIVRILSILILSVVLTCIVSVYVVQATSVSTSLFLFFKKILGNNCTIDKILKKTIVTENYTGSSLLVYVSKCSKMPIGCIGVKQFICNFTIFQNIEPVVRNVSNNLYIIELIGLNPAKISTEYVYKIQFSKDIIKFSITQTTDGVIIILPSKYRLYYCTNLVIEKSYIGKEYVLYLLKPSVKSSKLVTCSVLLTNSEFYRVYTILDFCILALVCAVLILVVSTYVISRFRSI